MVKNKRIIGLVMAFMLSLLMGSNVFAAPVYTSQNLFYKQADAAMKNLEKRVLTVDISIESENAATQLLMDKVISAEKYISGNDLKNIQTRLDEVKALLERTKKTVEALGIASNMISSYGINAKNGFYPIKSQMFTANCAILRMPNSKVKTVLRTNYNSTQAKFAELQKSFKSVTNVIVNPMQGTLMVGETAAMTASIQPDNATIKKVIWSTSDYSVATIDENGIVKGIGPGKATIKAVSANSGKYGTTEINIVARPILNKDITSFVVKNVPGASAAVIDESNKTITVTVPYETDVTNIIAEYAIPQNTYVVVYGAIIKSGVTPINYAAPVRFQVVDADNVSKYYTVTMKRAANTKAYVTSNSYTVGADTIYSIPYGTNTASFLANLTPCFGATSKLVMKTTGASVASGSVTSAMELQVTSQDGSVTKKYALSINLNSDASVRNATGTTKFVIGASTITAAYGTTYADLLTNLVPADGATMVLYQANGITAYSSAALVPGLLLKVRAQDQITLKIYEIAVSSASSSTILTSNVYAINQTANAITQIPAATPYYTFLSYLTAGSGATIQLVQNDGTTPVVSGNIQTGMKVKVTAQDGSSVRTYFVIINANTATTLTSGIYTIANSTIMNVPYGTQYATFYVNLIPSTGATVAVYQPDGVTPVTSGTITSLMKVKVTAQDGVSATLYTVVANNNNQTALQSATYLISNGAISFVPAGTTYSSFVSAITLPTGATMKVCQADGVTQVTSGTISTGMKVIVTAQDASTTALYTVTVLP